MQQKLHEKSTHFFGSTADGCVREKKKQKKEASEWNESAVTWYAKASETAE